MTVRGDRTDAQGYEKAQDGTIYWTLSLYIEADKVARAAGLGERQRVKPTAFGAVQRRHLPSLALANAIDPLMNDIADRESQGRVQEFLLAAIDDDERVFDSLTQAGAAIRAYKDLVFKLPKSVSWTTEGVRFHAHPEGLDDDRVVRLRRFWLSHNNGALSYHLSFSHYYGADYAGPDGARSGYDPSTYYFLSLLQKLGAPKEYVLWPTKEVPDPSADVFEAGLNIDPLDNIKVRIRRAGEAAGASAMPGAAEGARFWPFVRTMFEADADALFRRLTDQIKTAPKYARGDYACELLDLVPFIEAPGLKVPKSRFMFMLHDTRFFNRLMPLDPGTNELLPRKQMVQQGCFDVYQERIRTLLEPIEGQPPEAVHMGKPDYALPGGQKEDADYWTWVRHREDYKQALDQDVFARRNPEIPEDQLDSEVPSHWLPLGQSRTGRTEQPQASVLSELTAAIRAGECYQRFKVADPASGTTDKVALDPPIKHHIPAFEPGRPDCLDYLFLAGFNQNIIDFMNQDTSEILDSTDPIYPETSEQSDERFFVRYANHRAMITYVPRSRSLEIGNDYIGACPYAFLIHALALHNEFLARGYEEKTLLEIGKIEAMLQNATEYDDAELAINTVKLARFSDYENFRYANPFRYDTERVVFSKLEQLRGVSRKNDAFSLAIASLEDHAKDLARRQQRKADEGAAKRGQTLNILLGMTGVFGAGQMFYWIGEKTRGKEGSEPEWPSALSTPIGQIDASPQVGNFILAATEVVMIVALVAFLVTLWVVLKEPVCRFFKQAPAWLISRWRERPRKRWPPDRSHKD